MAVGSKLQLEPGSWAEFVYDVTIGFSVGAAHSLYFVARWFYLHILRVLRFFGIDSINNGRINEEKGEKALKVVAVGYGRTGTVRSFWCQSRPQTLVVGRDLVVRGVSLSYHR
jgi:hypothetical protein